LIWWLRLFRLGIFLLFGQNGHLNVNKWFYRDGLWLIYRCLFLPFIFLIIVVFAAQRLIVKFSDVLIQLHVLSLHLVSDRVDVLELLGEIRQAIKDFLNNDDAEALALALSTERFDHEFERNVLQNAIKQLVLDDCAEEFCDFLEVLLWIAVQEPILVEQAMKHACVYFLLFYDL
jgi:predicted house-cleaning noncanonical NTP pyrophosphatase (MazG superfamily)